MGGLKKKIVGAGKVAMGKAQKEAGEIMGDPGMEARGKEKEVAGRAEINLGKVQDDVREKEHKAQKEH